MSAQRICSSTLFMAMLCCGCDSQTARKPDEVSPVTVSSQDQQTSARTHESVARLESILEKTAAHEGPTATPVFEECAASSGIDFSFYTDTIPDRYFLPEIMGGGATWIDFDRDGLLDLYLTNGCQLDAPDGEHGANHFNQLYRNLGDGRFESTPTTSDTGNPAYGQGCAAGDYNSDGFLDLYIGNYGKNALLLNNGDGTFEVRSDSSETGEDVWTTSVLWHDLNADGLLDLYVTNYLDVTIENLQQCTFSGKPGYCGPGKYDAVFDRALINLGDGRFADQTGPLGLERSNGKGLAITAADLDGDLHAEIYVANDMVPNFLFTQDGEIGNNAESANTSAMRYRNVASVAGCAVSDVGQNEASMGIACSDFDGDGRTDIFLTHFYAQKNTLYRNLGNLLFQDDSRRTRVAATSFQTLGFGTVPIDFDGDGADELFIANGHVLGPLHDPFAMHPQLLHNDGSGRFTDVSADAGSYFDELCVGRGVAAGDFDNDGDADIVVTHLDRNTALLRDDSPKQGNWVGLDLRTESRTHPTGARVIIRSGDWKAEKSVTAGGSYLSWNDQRVRFAVPHSVTGSVEVEIHWPSGRKQIRADVAIGSYTTVLELNSTDGGNR